ncbi:hypothetical protein CRENBAI_004704 [Crenichthys baileyi]|uniref:Uncharacterized protein n=1 Tax=Crenichthys baileyi TaxID=28760 RepID=A0AAV9R5C5_9TELE
MKHTPRVQWTVTPEGGGSATYENTKKMILRHHTVVAEGRREVFKSEREKNSQFNLNNQCRSILQTAERSNPIRSSEIRIRTRTWIQAAVISFLRGVAEFQR